MKKKSKPVATLTFNGERHADHALQVDDLPDLIAYKDLLVATAREVFLREHPDRERVPRGFTDSINLRFDTISEGSTAVPLSREVFVEEDALDMDVEDEVDRAARIIDITAQAASENRPLPDETPAAVLPLFEKFGSSLQEGESIRICSAGRSESVAYTPRVRERLAQYQSDGYEDTVELEGEVRAADLDGRRFVVRYGSDQKVDGVFADEMEEDIITALRQHKSCRLWVSGKGLFSRDGALKRILAISDWAMHDSDQGCFDPSVRPIWEVLGELGAQVPDEDWATVPHSSSSIIDEHLYEKAKPGQ